ncbi:hypothetical protein MKW94_021204 [Papaver nudicaule]|uniref:Copine C-terminal domain-containing protein n=1 Tax=Papaver nudicaule TaxID=74823 RepID=A0AA41S5R0_PAPNU|nr:hypothetical protein [Papaver nudicaule]
MSICLWRTELVSTGLRGILRGEPINLIFGICFNRSRSWTVRENNLHYIDDDENRPNAYENVIKIIGGTVNGINPDYKSIYCFGFGDATTHHLDIFRFSNEPCNGVKEAVKQYRHAAKTARPTERVSYGPIIRKATCIASEDRDKHHVLVIIASEPVTRSFDIKRGQLSPDEENTYRAIKDARNFRLSIVLVGVGETNANMKNGLGISRCCKYNNFNFVDYTQIMRDSPLGRKETDFCVALTENLPSQIRKRASLSNLIPEEVPSSVDYPPLLTSSPNATQPCLSDLDTDTSLV